MAKPAPRTEPENSRNREYTPLNLELYINGQRVRQLRISNEAVRNILRDTSTNSVGEKVLKRACGLWGDDPGLRRTIDLAVQEGRVRKVNPYPDERKRKKTPSI